MNLVKASRQHALREDATALASMLNLYGRENEVSQLLDAATQTSFGQGIVMLVPGTSGAGKTSLVNVLREPIQARNGVFLEGKFNQYDENLPYVAWRRALAAFCLTLSQEEKSVRELWRADIQNAVGRNGQLLLDLVPEFIEVLGEQEPVDDISPSEAEHRFAGVILSVLQVICRPEHPAVIFIDDCQWADAASLKLLKQLQIGSSLRYLLLIAAYRDDEVDEHHPWITSVDTLRQQSVPMLTTVVGNLSLGEVELLVADTLEEFGRSDLSLGKIVFEKTQGNPFFAHTLVKTIASELRAENGSQSTDLPDDVIEIFARRMDRLDSECQRLLANAACLGNEFDLNFLAISREISTDECKSLLEQAIDIVEVIVDASSSIGAARKRYRFSHDRIQQVAYMQIPENERPAYRLRIARRLLASLGPDELAENICEVTEQFNLGVQLVTSVEERIRGVELNVAAARKARAATAFRSALRFHQAAQCCLDTESLRDFLWSEHHQLALDLHIEQAESEFFEGNRTEAERLLRLASKKARTPIEKANALRLLVVHHTLQARYSDAIAVGREALEGLGLALPKVNYKAARDEEIGQMRRLLNDRSADDVLAMPNASDETMMAAAMLLITMGPPCYRAHQDLWSVIVPRVVNITLEHGHVPEIGYSHPAITGLLSWVANDFKTGAYFSEIAARLIERGLASASNKSVYHLMIGSSARHWFRHLVHSSEDYLEAIQTGRESGNLQYAAYAFGHNMYCRFFQGIPLDRLIRESESSLSFSQTRYNQWAINLLEGGLRVFQEISGHPFIAEVNPQWEPQFLKDLALGGNQQVACIYQILRTQQCLMMGSLDNARAYSDASHALVHTVGTQGLLPWTEHVFARALLITAEQRNNANEDRNTPAELSESINQLKVWASQCPENFLHKYLLVTAEQAWLGQRFDDAAVLFDQSIEVAKENSFAQWEGYANEEAAKFWQSQGNGALAQIYWREAFLCFDRWGAVAKVESLLQEYRSSLTNSLIADVSGESSRDAKLHIVERQIDLFKSEVASVAEARASLNVEMQAKELASVTDALRANVAEGRRSSKRLREQRDAQQILNEELERRVKKRTSELERLTLELQDANRVLANSNKELEEFAYVASHDLQEPLRKVSSFCQLLATDYGDRLDDEGRQYMSYIVDSANRMRQLIQDLLAFSRIQYKPAGGVEFDANLALADALYNLQASIEAAGAIVTHDTLPVVRGNERQFSQLFQNLVGNAVKYRGDAVPMIHVGVDEDDAKWTFSVADNGIGIAPRFHEKVFGVFKRLHSRDNYPGTGIGLAICRRIVDLLQGELWVESEEMQGATFRFTVPKSIHAETGGPEFVDATSLEHTSNAPDS